MIAECSDHPARPERTKAIRKVTSVVRLFLPLTCDIDREREAATFKNLPRGSNILSCFSMG
jgi:hypothetical protein